MHKRQSCHSIVRYSMIPQFFNFSTKPTIKKKRKQKKETQISSTFSMIRVSLIWIDSYRQMHLTDAIPDKLYLQSFFFFFCHIFSKICLECRFNFKIIKRSKQTWMNFDSRCFDKWLSNCLSLAIQNSSQFNHKCFFFPPDTANNQQSLVHY